MYNAGFHGYLLLGYVVYLLGSKNGKRILLIVPTLLVFAVCILSPVNGELRYMLPVMIMLPLNLQTEPETYLRVLFPFHYRLNPDFTRALCAAPGVDDVFALLRDSPYRDCFDGVAVGAVEEYYQRAICRFNKRQLAAVPPSIYTAVAYLELKELELSVLINVIESVKYGVPYRAELADLVGQ